MKPKNSIIVFLTVVLSACSTTKEVSEKKLPESEMVESVKNDVNLEIEKSVSWVNLMPGSRPKFHISGSVALLQSDDYDYEITELKLVKVYQGGKEIYYIKPKVMERPGEKLKNIIYSTITGLSVNRDLDLKKPVDFEMVFDENGEELIYMIKGINVDEVQ